MTRLPSVILVSGIALCVPHSVAGGGNQGGGDGAEIQGHVTYTSTWTGGQFRETKVVTVTGTWHASSNPWFKVTCGGGTLGLKSPLTFGGLAGTISADITWSDSATRTPPSTKEEIEAARQDIVRRHITVTLPFRVTRDESENGTVRASNGTVLGCVYLEPKSKRFAFDRAWFNNMNNWVGPQDLHGETWNALGEKRTWTPPARGDSLWPGEAFTGTYDPTLPAFSGKARDEEMARVDAETHGQDDHEHREIGWTYSFQLKDEETELVLLANPEEMKRWKDWLPLPGFDPARGGSPLPFTARLLSAKGTPVQKRARKISFFLDEVSKEPGRALNGPADNGPDLRFEASQNPKLLVQSASQAVTTGDDLVSQATAVVTAFDTGGWGKLRATAELEDGKTIDGHLAGDKTMTSILVPQRTGDSHIADAWKNTEGVSGKPDTWDDETQPRLDGGRGDGLSLYEEYRGVIAKGEFQRLSPKKKDLVIESRLGEKAQSGLDLFARASQVNVVALENGELPASRVVNGTDGYAHNADQYGLLLLSGAISNDGTLPGGETAGQIFPPEAGRVTSPKSCEKIVFEPRMSTNSVSIAHEIGHGLGANHHGDREYDPIGDIRGQNVLIFDDSGHPLPTSGSGPGPFTYPDEPAGSWRIRGAVGTIGGQSSGDFGCIMAYTNLYNFVRHGTREYHMVPKPAANVGDHFCTSAAGTMINDPNVTRVGGNPFSYFGNAGEDPPGATKQKVLKRGNCIAQMHIRDSDAPPPTGGSGGSAGGRPWDRSRR